MAVTEGGSGKLHEEEPVLVGTLATAVVGYVLATLVEHGVITDTQASTATQVLVPACTSALLLAVGLVLRHFVSPAKKVERVLAQGLHLTDADLGRIEAVLSGLGLELVQVAAEHYGPHQAEHAALEPDPNQPPPPDGMSAGAL